MLDLERAEKHLTSAAGEVQGEVNSVTGKKITVSERVMAMPRSHLDQVTTAEILWAMKVVERDLPFSTCEEIGELFRLMFPDTTIGSDFKCGASKVSYLIT